LKAPGSTFPQPLPCKGRGDYKLPRLLKAGVGGWLIQRIFARMDKQFNNRKELKDRRRDLRNNPTRAEKEMWQGLRKHRAAGYKFRRQHSLGPFIVDFYLPEWKLAVEIDGATHDDPIKKEYDARRTEFLHANKVEVIRFTDGEVLWSVDMCVEKILKKIEHLKDSTAF
jgi:very-short-patch-repair endonuclease